MKTNQRSSESLNLVDESKKLAKPFPVGGLKYTGTYREDLKKILAKAREGNLIQGDSEIEKSQKKAAIIQQSQNLARESTQFKLQGLNFKLHSKLALDNFSQGKNGNKIYRYCQELLLAIENCKSEEDIRKEFEERTLAGVEIDGITAQKNSMKIFFDQFCTANRTPNQPDTTYSPFIFFKQALKKEIRLIKDQVNNVANPAKKNVSKDGKDLQAWSESRVPFYQDSLEEDLKFPREKFVEQVTKLADVGSLNIAYTNPAVKIFKSKIPGIEITDTLSSDQIIALEGIDNAISKSTSQMGGYAKVLMATGGGKSHLTRIVEEEYKASGLVTDVLTIDLNNYDKALGSFGGKFSEFKKTLINLFDDSDKTNLEKVLIQMDESYFYSLLIEKIQSEKKKTQTSSLTTSQSKKAIKITEAEIEKARNDVIRNLRKRGATIVTFGASESLSKMAVDITRLNDKIAEIGVKIDKMNKDKTSKAYQEYIKNIRGHAVTDPMDETKAGAVNNLHRYLSAAKSAPSVDLSQARGWGLVDQDIKDKIKRDAKLISTFADDRDSEQKIFNEEERKKFKALKAALSSKEMKDIYLRVNDVLKDPRINKLLKDFYATQIEEEKAKIVVLQQRLEVKKEQYADLQSRRDVETMERFDRATKDGRFVTKATDLEKDLHGQRLFKLVEGTLPDLSNVPPISVVDESDKETLVNRVGKMQYVLPDFEITDRSCTIDDLDKIQQASNADIIIIPFKEPGKDLQCKIYWKPQGETDFRLEIKSLAAHKETDSEEDKNKHLSKIIAGGNHKILSFFDKKNAIGGDYGSAGVNITHQSILAKNSDKLTANKLMQCNRDRTAKILGDVKRLGSDVHFTPIEGNDPVERQFIIQEEISLEDLKSKIDSNTKQDDENHVVGYLRSKIDGLIGGIENKSLSEFEESNLLRYKEYLIKEPWKNFSSENDNKTQSDSLSESNSNSGLQAISSTPKKEVQNHVNDCNELDKIAVEITKNVEIQFVGNGDDKEYICIKDDGENPAVMIVYEGALQKEYKIPFRYYIIDDEDIKLIKDKLSKAEETFNSLKEKSENIKKIFDKIASDKKNFTVGDLEFSIDDLDGDGDDYAKVIISKNKNGHETRYLFSKGVFVVSNPENSESSNHKIEYKTSATIIDEILAHFEEMSEAIELSKTLEEKIKQVFNLQGDVANLYSGGGMLYEKISGDFGSHKGYSISEEGSDGKKSDILKFDFDDGNIVKCNGEFQTSAQIEQRIAELELFFKQESTKIAERKALLEEIVNLSDTLKGNEVVLSESGKKIVVELKSQESDGKKVNWYELKIYEKDDSAETKGGEEAYKIEKVYAIDDRAIRDKTQDPEVLLNPEKWSEVREYLIAAVPVLTTELKKEAQSINKIFEGLVMRSGNSFENKDIKISRASSGVVFEQKKADGESFTYSTKSELINKRSSSEPESLDKAIRTISELEDIKKNFSKILEQKKASGDLHKSLEDLFNASIGLTKDEIKKGEITAKCDKTKEGKNIYTAFIDNAEGQPEEFTFTFTKGKLVEILQGTEAKADDVKLLETLNTAVVSKTNKAKALKLSAAQLQKTSILQNLNKTAKTLLELKVADHEILKEVGIVDIEAMQFKPSQGLNLVEGFKITFQKTEDGEVDEVSLLRPDDFLKEVSRETYNLSDLIKKDTSLSELLAKATMQSEAKKLKAVFDEIAPEITHKGKDGFDITEKSDLEKREEFRKITNDIFSIKDLTTSYEYRFKPDGVCGVTFDSEAENCSKEEKLNTDEIAEDIKRFSRILNQKKTQIFAELKEDFLKILGEKDFYESKDKKFSIKKDVERGIFTLAVGEETKHDLLIKEDFKPQLDGNENPYLPNLSLVKSNLAAFQAQLHEEAKFSLKDSLEELYSAQEELAANNGVTTVEKVTLGDKKTQSDSAQNPNPPETSYTTKFKKAGVAEEKITLNYSLGSDGKETVTLEKDNAEPITTDDVHKYNADIVKRVGIVKEDVKSAKAAIKIQALELAAQNAHQETLKGHLVAAIASRNALPDDVNNAAATALREAVIKGEPQGETLKITFRFASPQLANLTVETDADGVSNPQIKNNNVDLITATDSTAIEALFAPAELVANAAAASLENADRLAAEEAELFAQNTNQATLKVHLARAIASRNALPDDVNNAAATALREAVIKGEPQGETLKITFRFASPQLANLTVETDADGVSNPQIKNNNVDLITATDSTAIEALFAPAELVANAAAASLENADRLAAEEAELFAQNTNQATLKVHLARAIASRNALPDDVNNAAATALREAVIKGEPQGETLKITFRFASPQLANLTVETDADGVSNPQIKNNNVDLITATDSTAIEALFAPAELVANAAAASLENADRLAAEEAELFAQNTNQATLKVHLARAIASRNALPDDVNNAAATALREAVIKGEPQGETLKITFRFASPQLANLTVETDADGVSNPQIKNNNVDLITATDSTAIEALFAPAELVANAAAASLENADRLAAEEAELFAQNTNQATLKVHLARAIASRNALPDDVNNAAATALREAVIKGEPQGETLKITFRFASPQLANLTVETDADGVSNPQIKNNNVDLITATDSTAIEALFAPAELVANAAAASLENADRLAAEEAELFAQNTNQATLKVHLARAIASRNALPDDVNNAAATALREAVIKGEPQGETLKITFRFASPQLANLTVETDADGVSNPQIKNNNVDLITATDSTAIEALFAPAELVANAAAASLENADRLAAEEAELFAQNTNQATLKVHLARAIASRNALPDDVNNAAATALREAVIKGEPQGETLKITFRFASPQLANLTVETDADGVSNPQIKNNNVDLITATDSTAIEALFAPAELVANAAAASLENADRLAAEEAELFAQNTNQATLKVHLARAIASRNALPDDVNNAAATALREAVIKGEPQGETLKITFRFASPQLANLTVETDADGVSNPQIKNNNVDLITATDSTAIEALFAPAELVANAAAASLENADRLAAEEAELFAQNTNQATLKVHLARAIASRNALPDDVNNAAATALREAVIKGEPQGETLKITFRFASPQLANLTVETDADGVSNPQIKNNNVDLITATDSTAIEALFAPAELVANAAAASLENADRLAAEEAELFAQNTNQATLKVHLARAIASRNALPDDVNNAAATALREAVIKGEPQGETLKITFRFASPQLANLTVETDADGVSNPQIKNNNVDLITATDSTAIEALFAPAELVANAAAASLENADRLAAEEAELFAQNTNQATLKVHLARAIASRNALPDDVNNAAATALREAVIKGEPQGETLKITFRFASPQLANLTVETDADGVSNPQIKNNNVDLITATDSTAIEALFAPAELVANAAAASLENADRLAAEEAELFAQNTNQATLKVHLARAIASRNALPDDVNNAAATALREAVIKGEPQGETLKITFRFASPQLANLTVETDADGVSNPQIKNNNVDLITATDSTAIEALFAPAELVANAAAASLENADRLAAEEAELFAQNTNQATLKVHLARAIASRNALPDDVNNAAATALREAVIKGEPQGETLKITFRFASPQLANLTVETDADGVSNPQIKNNNVDLITATDSTAIEALFAPAELVANAAAASLENADRLAAEEAELFAQNTNQATLKVHLARAIASRNALPDDVNNAAATALREAVIKGEPQGETLKITFRFASPQLANLTVETDADGVSNPQIKNNNVDLITATDSTAIEALFAPAELVANAAAASLENADRLAAEEAELFAQNTNQATLKVHLARAIASRNALPDDVNNAAATALREAVIKGEPQGETLKITFRFASPQLANLTVETDADGVSNPQIKNNNVDLITATDSTAIEALFAPAELVANAAAYSLQAANILAAEALELAEALAQSETLASRLEELYTAGARINDADATKDNPITKVEDRGAGTTTYGTSAKLLDGREENLRFIVRNGAITQVINADDNRVILSDSVALAVRNNQLDARLLEVTAQAEEAERLKAEEIELAAAIAQSGVLKGKLEDLFNAGVRAPEFDSAQNNPTTKETAVDGTVTYTTTIKKDGLSDKVLAFEIKPAQDLIKVKVDGSDSANNSEALNAHDSEIDEKILEVTALVSRLERAKIQADKMAATEGQHDNIRVNLERLFGEMEKLASVDSNAKSVISKEADDDKITYTTILKSLVNGSDQELTFTFQGNDVVEVASGGRIYPSTASSLIDFSIQIANKMSKIEEQMKLLKRAEAVSTIQSKLPKLKFRKDAHKAISAKNEQHLTNLNSNFVDLFAEEQALLENGFDLESSPTTFQEFPADATNPARRIFTTKIEKGGVKEEEIQFTYSSEDVTDAVGNVTKKESRVVTKFADGSVASHSEVAYYDAAIAKRLENAKNAPVKKAAATKIQAQGRGLIARNQAQALRNEALITTSKDNLASFAAQEEAFLAQDGISQTTKTRALASEDSTSYSTTVEKEGVKEEMVLTVTEKEEISLVKKGSDRKPSPNEIERYKNTTTDRDAGASHNSASVTGKSKFADLVHKYFDVKKFALENLEEIQKNNAFDNKLDRAAKKVLEDDFSNLTTLDKITLANFYNETKKPSKPITKESLDNQKSDSYLLMKESIKELAETRFKDVESRVADKKSYSKSVYKALDETVSKYPSEGVKEAFARTLKDKILGLTNEKRK